MDKKRSFNLLGSLSRDYIIRPFQSIRRVCNKLGSSRQASDLVSDSVQEAKLTGLEAKILVQEEVQQPEIEIEAPESCLEPIEKCFKCIVFSDTDNDTVSVKSTLRFAGILDEQDKLVDGLNNLTLFHTGDLVDKKRPDPDVVEYWQSLQREASVKDCQVKLIVGNHEQEIWQKIAIGKKMGLDETKVRQLQGFIESLDLFYLEGTVLFIHGYPTLEFLQTLQHYREVTGKALNFFNADHYRKAFKSSEAMRQYAYIREGKRANYLLYDVMDAARYYKKHGQSINALFMELDIQIVIHGHRPQRSGVQVDYEFKKWLPNVRMIGNDTKVRYKGLGATVFSSKSDGTMEVLFINTKNKSKGLRKKVSEYLV
ncbi:MAG: metallophosphoesterase [Candidatus Thiodiazotropha sp. (ex Codakia rugifera)]|nr:metallophosphoesterase [Candidatus Thiodiazotropha sp. (ex Codakia rugifera)]